MLQKKLWLLRETAADEEGEGAGDAGANRSKADRGPGTEHGAAAGRYSSNIFFFKKSMTHFFW